LQALKRSALVKQSNNFRDSGTVLVSLWSDLVSVLPIYNLNNRLDVRREYAAFKRKQLSRKAFLKLLAGSVQKYDGPGATKSELVDLADRLSRHPTGTLHHLSLAVEILVDWCDQHDIVLVDL
jgi:hypothetical protein